MGGVDTFDLGVVEHPVEGVMMKSWRFTGTNEPLQLTDLPELFVFN